MECVPLIVVQLEVSTVRIPVDPDPEAAAIRDLERERDAVSDFSWAHTFHRERQALISVLVEC
jgi:hypothetical protein